MNRKTITAWFLVAFTTVALAATFDYNPPPLGSSETEKRNDLNLELDGINSTKADLTSPTFTGTVSGITKSMVGLGNVDNTSDANKPVSTATQTALDLKETVANVALKAPIASPTFTGTVSGITKSMVGLGNVDNTSDANKPISTAQQTALDLKADLASPTFTGTPSAPNAVAGTSTAQIATTQFVTTADNLKANLASPTFTGTPAAPTASAATNTTQIATTAFVTTADNLKANLASPALTGVPTAPTAAVSTNTTQIATTAFVLANSGGMTLVATIATTSGNTVSQTTSLTGYRHLHIEFDNVSMSSPSSDSISIAISGNAGANYGTAVVVTSTTSTGSDVFNGAIELYGYWTTNRYGTVAQIMVANSGGAGGGGVYDILQIGKASTGATGPVDAIQFTTGANFDAGAIRIYGVR